MAEVMPFDALLELQTASFSDVGGRLTNQDALLNTQREQLYCCAVADGAGGHAGGELASRLVIDSLADAFQGSSGFGPAQITEWFSHASHRVAQEQITAVNNKSMSATAALLLLDMRQGRGQALWGHLGDTRIYFFRNGKIESFTKDHSVVQQFIDAGYCTAEEGKVHPQRHVLYGALGAEGEAQPVVTEQAVALQAGDAFLICSDGLWEWLEHQEMELALRSAGDVEGWLCQMQEISNSRAKVSASVRDNTTAIALWVGAA